MTRHFNITPIKNSKYQCIVFSLTTERLDNYIYDLEKELEKLKVAGDILLDLIVSNGIKYRRYIVLYFDGKEINLRSYKNIDKIGLDIQEASNSFYNNHFDVIENSVLTRPQKFLFRKQLKKDKVSR